MKKIVLILSCIIALSTMIVSCGGSKSSSPQAEQQRSQLIEAINAGDIARIDALADSLANEAEYLSTDESVAVLIAFLNVHNDAADKKDADKDLVTIRKFVDFYNLAYETHGEDLVKAFNRAKELNEQLDLQQVVEQFSSRLAEFATGTAEEEPGAAAPVKKAEEPKAEAEQPKAEQPAEKPAAQPAPEVAPVD